MSGMCQVDCGVSHRKLGSRMGRSPVAVMGPLEAGGAAGAARRRGWGGTAGAVRLGRRGWGGAAVRRYGGTAAAARRYRWGGGACDYRAGTRPQVLPTPAVRGAVAPHRATSQAGTVTVTALPTLPALSRPETLRV